MGRDPLTGESIETEGAWVEPELPFGEFDDPRTARFEMPLLERSTLFAPPSGPALVFAFGSNMVARQMAARCPKAVAVSIAELRHHRLDFVGWSAGWKGGVATVTPVEALEVVSAVDAPRVPGVLWRLPVGGLDRLDAYEGHPDVYRRERMVCHAWGGGTVLAWVYCHRRPILTPPSPEYLNALYAGAGEFKVPTSGIAKAAKRARKHSGDWAR